MDRTSTPPPVGGSYGGEQMASSGENKFSHKMSGVKDTVRDAGSTLKDKAREVGSRARQEGEEYFQRNKSRTAARIQEVSETLRQSAQRFEEEEDPNIAHYTRTLADKLENTASYLRDQDLQRLRHDAENLARQHPGLFFGGMFIAGLAAARFVKASSESSSEWEQGSETESGQIPVTPSASSPQPASPVL